MKIKSLLAALFMAVMAVACSNSVSNEYIGILKEAMDAVENTKTVEEYDEVSKEYLQKIADFADTHAKELDALPAEEKESVEAAQQAFNKVYQQKAVNLITGM